MRKIGDVRAVCRIKIIKRVRNQLVNAPTPKAAKKPQSILFDRSAFAEIQIVNDLNLVPRRQSALSERSVDIVALPPAWLAGVKRRSLERIPAGLGNHVH